MGQLPEVNPNHNAILFEAERWRVTDDGIQWILWVRKGNPRRKASGYRGHAFCLWRTALLRSVREKFGHVPPEFEQVVATLPERHPGPTDRRAKSKTEDGNETSDPLEIENKAWT